MDVICRLWFVIVAAPVHFPYYFLNPAQGHITKTRLYNFDSLKPHFYIVPEFRGSGVAPAGAKVTGAKTERGYWISLFHS